MNTQLLTATLLAATLHINAQPITKSGELSDPFKKNGNAHHVQTPGAMPIGNVMWTTANLDVTTFRNGDPIPEAKTDAEWMKVCKQGTPAWCWYNNDPANVKYGRLYNRNAVNDPRGLAPAGWHIPTITDWEKLLAYFRSANVSYEKIAGASGFAFIAGGYRLDDNGKFSFSRINKHGYWWSATEAMKDMACWGFSLEDDKNGLFRKGMFADDGLSVRCVKD